jgi:hypothetical protein
VARRFHPAAPARLGVQAKNAGRRRLFHVLSDSPQQKFVVDIVKQTFDVEL